MDNRIIDGSIELMEGENKWNTIRHLQSSDQRYYFMINRADIIRTPDDILMRVIAVAPMLRNAYVLLPPKLQKLHDVLWAL